MKRIFGLSLLVLSLLLASCTLPSGTTTPPDIAVGTRALEVTLKPVTTNLFMCQETDVLAELHNLGTADIDNGIYTYILEDQFLKPAPGAARKKNFRLDGKSQYNPQGGMLQSSLKLKNSGLPAQLETYNTPIIFSACYQYQTLASVPVCIDPDTLGKNPTKPCTVEPVSVGGQGAPVAVTRIEPSMIPTGEQVRPTFTIYVQNVGDGRVIASDSVEDACTGSTTTLAPTININARLQDQPLHCLQTSLRLDPGKETRFVCESQDTYSFAQGTFTGILTVEINYGYVNTASQQLTINRLPNQESCTS